MKDLWKQNPPLMATAILMLAALAGSIVGMAIDPREITGAPAWLKPAKFAISSAIFATTISWLYGYLSGSERLKNRFGWLIALALNIEVGIIFLQAARGTTSHYNIRTSLDAALFATMGIWIAILLGAMIGVFVLTMRQKFSDPAWGWALRLGLLITIIGSATGGIMISASAHTIGAPDGGPGIPGLDWSLNHGDLRVAHFFGLHAIQIIPFLAWFLRRTKAMVFTIAASYLTFIAILTWQAMRGESVAHPGSETIAALGIWLVGTLAAMQVRERVYAA